LIGGQVLEQAISLHRSGKLAEAESLYRKLLSQNPHHADALSFLGLIEIQRKNLAAGIGLIDQAIRINPKNAAFFVNRGNGLRDLKRFDDALVSFDRALALRPRYAEAHYNRANVLRDLGRLDDALVALDRALEAKPDFAAALCARGHALLERRRFAEAIESYDRALKLKSDDAEVLLKRGVAQLELKRVEEGLASFDAALAVNPDYVEALNARGVVLQDLNRSDEALMSFDRALQLAPDFPEALNNRALVLIERKRFGEALVSIDRALKLKPDYAEALNKRGTALRGLKRFEEALASIERGLLLKPNGPSLINNRGVTLLDLDRLEEALAAFDAALALEPDRAEIHNNRGNVLLKQHHPQEALECFEQAIAWKPEYPDALFGRALCRLRLGDLLGGWSDYEYRWQAMEHAFSRRVDGVPDWQGEDLSGRSILVYAEQGYGDMIQFARYLPLLVGQGADVTFLVPQRLFALMRGLSGSIRLIAAGTSDRYNYQCAQMSLPLRFKTDLATIPSSVPYLSADPGRRAAWRAKLGTRGFKIGVAWKGAPRGDGRPVPLREFYPLSQIPGVRLVSLQKSDGLDELASLPPGMIVETLGDFDSGDAFVDTAAVMCELDLIVTCDTSIPHLAGALARPVWMATKWAAEWRWLMERDDSPWYPTMRLFRQKTPGGWSGVFEEIADAVRTLIRA
jgi:tetratricopeptide (TPR) repeat protein